VAPSSECLPSSLLPGLCWRCPTSWRRRDSCTWNPKGTHVQRISKEAHASQAERAITTSKECHICFSLLQHEVSSAKPTS
jgi:hypothetical protein